jgi:cation transport ATPase
VPERVSEQPGQGLAAVVQGRQIQLISRPGAARLLGRQADALLGPVDAGMECVIFIDGLYAATCRFRDTPRLGAKRFIDHLAPRHGITRTVMISGDRASEVAYVADEVGITAMYAGCTPEEKLAIVRRETASGTTVFLGDGINDAPAMTAASVGIAFGAESDVTSQAAGAVVLDSSLERTDELLHIGRRMRMIALQSVLGGMTLSVVGMGLAVVGLLPPVLGAMAQELIDLLAVLNAARVALRRRPMADCAEPAPTSRRGWRASGAPDGGRR